MLSAFRKSPFFHSQPRRGALFLAAVRRTCRPQDRPRIMSDQSHPVIAIDGTAASGKSTFSRQLAQRLGYVYVNTGAMYRGVTWHLQQKNTPLRDAEAVAREVQAAGVETRLHEGELVFRIAGLDP